MPGPVLSKTFTYNGTPSTKTYPWNKLDRYMIQTQRFYQSKDTGTHQRTPLAVNIIRNSNSGKGIGNTSTTTNYSQ